MLLKEINYSPNHVFLELLDDFSSTYVLDFVEKCIDHLNTGSVDMLNSISRKNAVVTVCNSKYFKSCLTFITSVCKHSEKDIDAIYVFDLVLTEEEHHVLLN